MPSFFSSLPCTRPGVSFSTTNAVIWLCPSASLPVAAVTMVMLRYAHERYTHSGLYGAEHEAPDQALDRAEANSDSSPIAAEPAPRPDV